jgi:lysophospholipase L1-like esterase
MPMRWLKIAAVQMVIVFVLLEIAFRIYNPVGARVRGSEIVLPVGHVYRFDNGPRVAKIERHTVHTKNSLGFRGPDPPRDFAERLTILTIGGSTTEELFVSDGRTWTDELTRRLQRDFPDVWVNNAGIDGHTTYGHLVLLQSVVVRLRPRVAIFLVGANDVGLEQANTFDQGVLLSRAGVQRMVNAVATHSEVVSFGLNLVRAARARERGLGHSELHLPTAPHLVLSPGVMEHTVQQHRRSLPGYAARLHAIVDLTTANGIVPVLVTQPALFGATIEPTTGVDLSYVQVSGRGNGALEWQLLELVNDQTRRVAHERGVFLIDLARELPKDARLFYDFLHFSNEGSAQVGAIVAARLTPYLKRAFGALAQ